MEDRIVSENIGLVHCCAKKFQGKGIEYEELFQAGCLGLVKASKKFDESKGFKFSTYAVPVILGEIKALFRYGGTVKVSRTLKELSAQVMKVVEEYTREKSKQPTVTEIAEKMGLEVEKVAEAIGCAKPTESLSWNDDESSERQIPVDGIEEKITETLSLQETLNALNDEDKKIISLRYYMNKTQKETADLIGSSQVQVSRREKKILLYMRGVL